jgi:hypothetical protein
VSINNVLLSKGSLESSSVMLNGRKYRVNEKACLSNTLCGKMRGKGRQISTNEDMLRGVIGTLPLTAMWVMQGPTRSCSAIVPPKEPVRLTLGPLQPSGQHS